MSETDKLKVEMYDDVVKEKNKEYIELTCRFRKTCNDIKNKDKEIERLNNIINQVNTRNSRQRKANKDLEKEINFLKTHINYRLRQKNEEIERLNNIINKGIEAINVYQNEKTLSVGYQDLKRIRGILRGNEFDLQMFEKYLRELKGSE